jgi:2-polyprenyl-6-methoxyphenol hydroxylase-like FAD-dependent oxidoreductase
MTHIAIAGAGIAGLAAAILLHQQGRKVTIFDQVRDPTPVGAGLLLQPSGQAVMASLGLLPRLRERAARVSSLQGYTGRWHTLELRYQDLHPEWFGLGVHRAQLHQILWQRAQELGVEIQLGVALEHFQASASGVEIHTQAGSGHYSGLIIANGTRSQLREKLPFQQYHQAYPWGAYWAVLDKDDWPFPDILQQRYRGAHIMCGVLPTGVNPLTQRQCYSLFWSLPRSDFARYKEEGMPGLITRIHAVWPEVAAWLASAPETQIAIAEYADVRLPQWHHQNVIVIGDAAHAMSPQLGQGANIALIDATILAQCVAREPNFAQALANYSTRRAKHIAYYQFASRIMTPLYQSNYPIAWLRDFGTVVGRRIPPMYRQYLLTLCGAKQGVWDFEASIEKLLA